MVMYTCNPSLQEAEAGRSQIGDQLRLHSKFEASLGYKKKEKSDLFFNICITALNDKNKLTMTIRTECDGSHL
jgi:hypothetical protein